MYDASPVSVRRQTLTTGCHADQRQDDGDEPGEQLPLGPQEPGENAAVQRVRFARREIAAPGGAPLDSFLTPALADDSARREVRDADWYGGNDREAHRDEQRDDPPLHVRRALAPGPDPEMQEFAHQHRAT